jgi:hypothetical protein
MPAVRDFPLCPPHMTQVYAGGDAGGDDGFFDDDEEGFQDHQQQQQQQAAGKDCAPLTKER